MSESSITLSDATFDELVQGSSTTVVVDFWAEWCGPCKQIAPILDQIAAEQGDKVVIAKLNIEDNPETALRFEVMSIPTLLVFKDGEVVCKIVGAKPKAKLMAELEPFL